MARKRIIDTEEFYYDESLYKAVGERGMHMYIRLWGLAEDWGGIEADYAKLGYQMGALRMTSEEVENFVHILAVMGKIICYKIEGREYLWLSKFLKHQVLKNPPPPKLPLPAWIKCRIKQWKKSKKKYAVYELIFSNLPVAYQYANGSPRNETETEIETKRNRNEIETTKSKTVFLSEKDEKDIKQTLAEKNHHAVDSEANLIALDTLVKDVAKDKDVKSIVAVAKYRASK